MSILKRKFGRMAGVALDAGARLGKLQRSTVAIVDPFEQYVALLLSFDGISNLVDRSPAKRAVSVTGDIVGSSAPSRYGDFSAIKFNGTALSKLSVPTIDLTGTFTIEMWAFKTTADTGGMLFCTGGFALSLYSDGRLKAFNATPAISDPNLFPTNEWVHVALTRDGSTMRLFRNGVLVASGASTLPSHTLTYIGLWSDNANYPWFGFIDDIRVTVGICRYTSDFNPPQTV